MLLDNFMFYDLFDLLDEDDDILLFKSFVSDNKDKTKNDNFNSNDDFNSSLYNDFNY